MMSSLNPTPLHDPLIETSVKEDATKNESTSEIATSVKEDFMDKMAVEMIEESVQEDLVEMNATVEVEKSVKEDFIDKMAVEMIEKSVEGDQIEKKALAARRRVPVRVVLPGRPPCLLIARPFTPLALLLHEAARGRPWFPVAGVSGPGGCLGPAWRDRRLGDCVGRLDALFVRPAAPARVRIAIVGPRRAGPTQEVTLDLAADDWSWGRVEAAAQRSPAASFGRAVASQWGLDYVRCGRRRRSISGLRRGRVVELDRSDGWPADWSNSTHLVCDFLAPSSGLRWTGGVTPLVVVWPSCDLFGVTRAGRLRLLEWCDEALLLPKWAAFLRARRCLWERSGEWSTFLQLRDGSYCCQASGDSFANEQELATRTAGGRRKWRRALILLEAGDPLPGARLPLGSHVGVFRRDGVEVAVRGGRIEARGGEPAAGSSTWTAPFRWLEDDLAEGASSAMREAF